MKHEYKGKLWKPWTREERDAIGGYAAVLIPINS